MRHLTATLVVRGPGGAWLRRRAQNSLVIVCYHRILSEAKRIAYHGPDLAVTPEAWEGHVSFLARHFECRTLQDGVKALRSGTNFGRPILVITFDDGYAECFDLARPVLNEHGVPGTFFIISTPVNTREAPWYDRLWRAWSFLCAKGWFPQGSDYPGGDPAADWIRERDRTHAMNEAVNLLPRAKALSPDVRDRVVLRLESTARELGLPDNGDDTLMNADQVAQLAREGHEIGSHTLSHPILTTLPAESVEKELGESKSELEAMTGKPVLSLAYPNGDHDDTVCSIAARVGYRFAVTTHSGVNSGAFDPLRLRRTFIAQNRLSTRSGQCSEPLLQLELSGLADTVFLRRLRSGRP